MKTTCSALTVAPDVTLYHTGPALDHGPLPSLFYFAISGPDSLTLDPFNQPVQFLGGKMVRIFSMTLPGHEANLPASGAMSIWAEEQGKGIDPFLDSVQLAVDFAIREKFADPSKLGAAGLSRGAFIAAHLAARDERFRFLLGFAPLTRLSKLKEFAHLTENPFVNNLDLIHLAKALGDRHVRLYIGNHDTRVGTRECFDFAMALVDHKSARTSQVELIIGPSIGHMGHGTSPEVFQQGAHWLENCLI
ncbi:MAG TPA: prolyl oligopeptidase family serine peptidase [Chlamydiales bacterium]|nr:prolyl oligopeptidase family serine peptidase [Chlamydiales bacterium]